MSYMLNVAIWLDQGVNVLIGGSPDETLSARAWRARNESAAWLVIDMLFFWQEAHCRDSYESEMQRRQMPREYRS